MAAQGPNQFYNQLSNTAEGILTTCADDMRISGGIMGQPEYVVCIAGEHMKTIAADGWTKAEMRKFLFEKTQTSHEHLKRTGRMSGAVQPGDDKKMRPLVAAPEDFMIVAAGGEAGAFSCHLPGWGSKRSFAAVNNEG